MDEYKFVKFPKTYWLPLGERLYKNERYLNQNELDDLFSGRVNISEKFDGSNVGLSFQQERLILQKRGGFVGEGGHPQYGAFKEWANERYHQLSKLPEDMILFGEWLFAKHSIHYTRLPDYFFLFDVWQNGNFLSVEERDTIAEKFGLYVPPSVYEGKIFLNDIPSLIRQSHYSDEIMEGVVVRNPRIRGKYVRPDFILGEKHWLKYHLTKNLLK